MTTSCVPRARGSWQTLRVASFPENLKRHMRAKALSQNELGRRLKTSGATVNRWLAGATQPTGPFLVRLAKELGVGEADLMGDDAAPVEAPARSRRGKLATGHEALDAALEAFEWPEDAEPDTITAVLRRAREDAGKPWGAEWPPSAWTQRLRKLLSEEWLPRGEDPEPASRRPVVRSDVAVSSREAAPPPRPRKTARG